MEIIEQPFCHEITFFDIISLERQIENDLAVNETAVDTTEPV